MSAGLAALSAYAAVVLLGRAEMIGVAFAGVAAWAGWMTVEWLRRWRHSPPVLTISSEGILDGTSLGRPYFIPWTDVESVSVENHGATLLLREGSAEGVPLARRALHRFVRKSRREYLIPTRGMDTPHAAGALISQYHEALLLDEVRRQKALLEGSAPDAAEGSGPGDQGE